MSSYQTTIGYNPAASKKKLLGGMIAGSLIGMNAYYIPVKKDVFMQRAFDITKRNADDKIKILGNIVDEISENKLSAKSKMILQEMGLNEDVVQITNKCIELDKKVSDSSEVRTLKNSFASNFDNYKKTPSLMDNTCAEAFKAIKRNKFKWGTGIGAAIGLALGLILGRD